jgi:hypothetical protein
MYFGSGQDANNWLQIGRLSPDGTGVTMAWATLVNETHRLRGSLYVDQTGIWGGDLIAVTSAEDLPLDSKGVWRLASNGTGSQVTRITTYHLEGAITLPDNAEKWGPWAGRLLTGDESARDEYERLQPLIYAVDPNGVAESFALGIEPEDFDIIPPDQDLYCADIYGGSATNGAVLKLSRTLLSNHVGDLLVTQAGEGSNPAKLSIVHWDGTNFVIRNILYPSAYYGGHFEHVTFAPLDLPSSSP